MTTAAVSQLLAQGRAIWRGSRAEVRMEQMFRDQNQAEFKRIRCKVRSIVMTACDHD
jgi:hypothetical protein